MDAYAVAVPTIGMAEDRQPLILEVPDEIMLSLVTQLFERDRKAALGLRKTCRAMRDKLGPVRRLCLFA